MLAKQRFFARMGLVIAALGLAWYWWLAVAAFIDGRLFTHVNYWHAPIGTITLTIGLVALTPLWFWGVWRFWNWQGQKVVED